MKITKCPYAGPEVMRKGKWAKVKGQKFIRLKDTCLGCGKVFIPKYKKQDYCEKCKKEYYEGV